MNSLNKKINITNIPFIRPGGSSDSQVLNEYFKVLADDIVFTLDEITKLSRNFDTLSYATVSLTDGLNQVITSLTTKLDSVIASGSGTVLLDLASSVYLNESESNCNVARKYSQATLPIETQTDLLVLTNTQGTTYTPDTVTVETGINGVFSLHPSGKDMIVGKTPLINQWNSATMDLSDTFSIRVNFPFKYQGLAATTAEFTLLPVFANQITSITYQTSTSSTDIPLDISYLPGYNNLIYLNDYVNNAGPVRVFLPNTEIVSITINFKLANEGNWGLWDFKLKNLSFEATGQIVLTSPLGNFTTVQILGKDPNDLSELSYTIDGDTITITLGSLDPFSSQVVTGIIVE